MKGFIDRFEGDYAILFLEPNQFKLVILKSFLPNNTKEGDAIIIDISIDHSKTLEQKNRIENLLDQIENK